MRATEQEEVSSDASGTEPARAGVAERLGDVNFDRWVLRRRSGELLRDGTVVRLQEQPLRILSALLAKPGELVTRQQLIELLWPKGIVVFDSSLNTAVRKLRTALADDPQHPRYVETVPRKGYRFIGRVTEPAARDSPQPRPSTNGSAEAEQPRSWRWIVAGAAAGLLVVAAATLTGAWSLEFIRGAQDVSSPSSNQSQTPALPPPRSPGSATLTKSPVAFDLYLRAKDRISQIMPTQAELPSDGGPPPRRQTLDWLAEALRLDPSFAHAYVLRARVNLDFFIANLDVSEARLASVRADLERARQLSQDESFGNEVRGLYATFVDVDPERGLRELRFGEDVKDADTLVSQARILTSMNRFRESDDLLRELLLSDPDHQLVLRMRGSNLISENRVPELIRLTERLREIGPPEADLRPWTFYFTGVGTFLDADVVSAVVAAAPSDLADEQLFAVLPDVFALQNARRHPEVKQILDASQARMLRFPSFLGASPGLGRRPVAELRGWNELLLGNPAAAAEHGRDLLAFAAAQPETRSNRWVLHMLRAEGSVFVGNHADAVTAVRESLRAAPLLPQVQTYRTYLAAINLAWAGEHEESVALLEKLTSTPPSVGPIRVARDALVAVPLEHDARYRALAAKLEEAIRDNQRLSKAALGP